MKVLVSACLLGMACRYDGRTKENADVIRLAKRYTLIPYCPEIYGGLATPREPSEIRDGRVYTKSGVDVTAQFEKGAAEGLRLCRSLGCDCALLQDQSPSCGCGVIHDGTFGEGLVEGDGVDHQASQGARYPRSARFPRVGTCTMPMPRELPPP